MPNKCYEMIKINLNSPWRLVEETRLDLKMDYRIVIEIQVEFDLEPVEEYEISSSDRDCNLGPAIPTL